MPMVAWMAALLCGSALGQQGPVVAVKTGKLLDPATQKVRNGAVVVIQDGRIKSVGETVPPGAQVVDASALSVSPGFIDTHTHVLLQGDLDGRRVRRADPQGVAGLPGAPRQPGDAHRARARVHNAA